eukprot:TRINITY_DN3694_c0_g2_i9.p1 TRINITY_DN3694_c0_g2~~TRINITY_DN3694_c0_g2_i9.p1  ORF type:complete len:131 (+),score=28.32 TRINITY_DN3694_c0_g2_i9:573-965(+)
MEDKPTKKRRTVPNNPIAKSNGTQSHTKGGTITPTMEESGKSLIQQNSKSDSVVTQETKSYESTGKTNSIGRYGSKEITDQNPKRKGQKPKKVRGKATGNATEKAIERTTEKGKITKVEKSHRGIPYPNI